MDEDDFIGIRHKNRGKRRFRALVRLVINNLGWLSETEFTTKRKAVKSKKKPITALTVEQKSLLLKREADRTDEEKHILYRTIGGLKCFRNYPEHVKMKLAGCTYYRFFGPDRVIVREKHRAEALYFVMSGELSVSVNQIDALLNEMTTIYMEPLEPGDQFGELALLYNVPRDYTITSITAVEFLILHREDFNVVLKDSVQKEWDYMLNAMSGFTYFDEWNDYQKRECCLGAKIRRWGESQTILGDKVGMKNFVHFVLKGKCKVIEHLHVTTKDTDKGKKQYRLYTAEPKIRTFAKKQQTDLSSVVGSIGSNAASKSQDGTLSKASLIKENVHRATTVSVSVSNRKSRKTSKDIVIPAGSRHSMTSTVTSTSHLRKSKKSNVKPGHKEVIYPYLGTTQAKNEDDEEGEDDAGEAEVLPPDVKTIFMQVCIFSEKACFCLGENMSKRRIVAITEVECLLIPSYWLSKVKSNVWFQVKQYLNNTIPNTRQVFSELMEQKRWREYRKEVVSSLAVRQPCNTIHNIPYSIRIAADYGYNDK